jgi:hypothetical protein
MRRDCRGWQRAGDGEKPKRGEAQHCKQRQTPEVSFG